MESLYKEGKRGFFKGEKSALDSEDKPGGALTAYSLNTTNGAREDTSDAEGGNFKTKNVAI